MCASLVDVGPISPVRLWYDLTQIAIVCFSFVLNLLGMHIKHTKSPTKSKNVYVDFFCVFECNIFSNI
jgi:hypothetical protein